MLIVFATARKVKRDRMERPSHPNTRRFSSFDLNPSLYASTKSTRTFFNLQTLKIVSFSLYDLSLVGNALTVV
jgi:hypothetical protein